MPTPYQRIIKAAKEGKGIRLSPQEVQDLSEDHAISEMAGNDDEIDRLPKDEKDHYHCFSPIQQMPWLNTQDCGGDGWYRCKECSHFSWKTEVSLSKIDGEKEYD